jgi:hypothetical protein
MLLGEVKKLYGFLLGALYGHNFGDRQSGCGRNGWGLGGSKTRRKGDPTETLSMRQAQASRSKSILISMGF